MVDSSKKYSCPDCSHCQWCSDERCRLCLKPMTPPRLSIRDQIALYERLNNHCDCPQDDAGAPESTP